MKASKVFSFLYQPYKWLVLIPLVCLNTLFWAIIAIVLSVSISEKAGGVIAIIWARINSFFTPIWVSVVGKHHINKKTSYIIVSNHQSLYDILVIYGWVGIDIKWVMKKELRKVPTLGVACEKIGHIFIDRSNREEALKSLNSAKSKLKDGTSVIVFPEGTRSKTGKLNPFKKGAFLLALDLQLPILPVTLIGTDKIMPADTFSILPGKAKMIIHSPIDVTKYTHQEIAQLLSDTRKIIEAPLQS